MSSVLNDDGSSLAIPLPSSSSSSYCITFDDVQAAARRIAGTAHVTPVLTSSSLNEMVAGSSNGSGGSCNLYFKVEALQKTGSFKFRGALNAVRSILESLQDENGKNNSSAASDASTESSVLHVVTHSSGNHAQALALAAQLSSTAARCVQATIVMPEATPLVKKKAVVAFGGIPIMVANTNKAREDEANRIQRETGAHFVHPSEDPRVIAGQGTVCLEFVQQLRDMNNPLPRELDIVIIEASLPSRAPARLGRDGVYYSTWVCVGMGFRFAWRGRKFWGAYVLVSHAHPSGVPIFSRLQREFLSRVMLEVCVRF